MAVWEGVVSLGGSKETLLGELDRDRGLQESAMSASSTGLTERAAEERV